MDPNIKEGGMLNSMATNMMKQAEGFQAAAKGLGFDLYDASHAQLPSTNASHAQLPSTEVCAHICLCSQA
jgi:hypothetical protein